MSSTSVKKFRKAVSLLLVLCLVFTLIPVNSVVKAATVTVYHEDFAAGIGAATQSGGASLSQVSDKVFDGNDDGKALYVEKRENSWDAVDFSFSALELENTKTYSITITGYIDSSVPSVTPGALIVAQPVKPSTDKYGNYLGQATVITGAAFTITTQYTADTSTYDRIRIQSDDKGAKVPFYIGDILITTDSTPSTPTVSEVYHETFEEGIGGATQSGGASLSHVSDKVFDGNPDGKALYVEKRENSWDAVDFSLSTLKLENGKTYNITIKGYIDENVTSVTPGALIVAQPVKPSTNQYGNYLGQAIVTTGAAFNIATQYTADTSTYDRIRIQSDDKGANVPFYIGDILITTETTDGGGNEEPAKAFTTLTFEDNTNGGFVPRGGVETLTVTNEENHTTDGALSLKVEGRKENWNGPSLSIIDYVNSGCKYKFSMWVKMASPSSAELQLSTQVGESSYNNINKVAATDDKWSQIEGTYTYNSVSSGKVTLYVESSTTSAAFYIDDISIEKVEAPPIVIQKDLTPIKDVYEDDFLIGNAVAPSELEGSSFELLKHHFNVITAGNDMKPDALQKTKGVFTYNTADSMIQKAHANGIQVHGHVLVWHEQTAAWMNTTTGGVLLSREEALENMTEHIKNVVQHFGNQVISWDVVNEAMGDNPSNPSDWRGSLRNNSNWGKAIGPDYIEQAFLAAREVIDQNGWNIKLYYNDYNEDNQNKADAIYNMVNEINTRYAEDHPGKLLIEGIGMQAHYNTHTKPENVEATLKKFISLGVEISVTELDIQAGSNNTLSAKEANIQAYLYGNLMKIFKNYSDSISRVTIWGLDDPHSWRASSSPLLFDEAMQAKPAYYAVVDPDKYMAEHEPPPSVQINEATAAYGTPVIDGNLDSIWNKAEEISLGLFSGAWKYATGKTKVLWDDSNLYVLTQVSDTLLNKDSADAWQQDSVEVFVDENNGKTLSYEDDDGQYRVNYDNETSFNPSRMSAGFESATKVMGTNYIVEMKIPFKSITPQNNVKIGFDAQVNDADSSKSRVGYATWNDTTGVGYQDTSVYGEVTLTGKGSGTDNGTGNNNTNNNTNNTSTNNSSSTADKSVISVSVPVIVNTDGSATANVTEKVVEDILKNIETVRKNEEKPVVTLKLDTFAKLSGATLKFPEATLSKIIKADKEASLKVVSADYEITFDSKTIDTISKAGTGATEIKVVKLAAADVAKLPAATSEKIAQRPVYEFTVTSGGKTVADFKDGTVTARIPYVISNNEDPNAIVAYWLDGKNSLVPVRGTYSNGYVVLRTTHFSKFAVGYNKVSFKDVMTTDSYAAAATYLGARGIVTGENFDAKGAVTRGEAIVMLLKAYNIKPVENPVNNFSDAAGEFAGYYAKAKEIGITSGVGNNRLAADTSITTEMLYVMLHNMISYLGEFPAAASPAKDQPVLKNSSRLAKWSVKSISKLVETGFVKEDEKTFNNPNANCVRGELSEILFSALSR